jgi:hypothetical protein
MAKGPGTPARIVRQKAENPAGRRSMSPGGRPLAAAPDSVGVKSGEGQQSVNGLRGGGRKSAATHAAGHPVFQPGAGIGMTSKPHPRRKGKM